MRPESESSPPAVAATPRLFCKKCGYALVGLSSKVCPECGRAFDPAHRRTFATRPPRGWMWRWGKRLAAGVLLLLLIAGAGLGWLWWGWHAEQPSLAQLRGPDQYFGIAPIGPPLLRTVLGNRLSYLTDRVEWARVYNLKAAQTGQLDFRSLTQIDSLWLLDCELKQSDLNCLAGLPKLRRLVLYHFRTEKPDLAFLEKLPVLSTLTLWGEPIPSAGFELIGRLGRLKDLTLYDTGATDGDLPQLLGLSSVEELNLASNPITEAGLEQFQSLRSLKRLSIDRRLVDSPGMAKLKQAIPGLQVIAY